MHAIPNHVNSNFQIAYFLVGSCHTPDGAYALLCNLREGREMALAQVQSASLREQAKVARATNLLQWSFNKADRLESKADLQEIESNKKVSDRNIEAAQAELNFINECISRVQPHRRFKDLTDELAHQAAQQEEWKLELIHRAENYMLTQGSIPADHFSTMRMHPEFITSLMPAIRELSTLMQTQEGQQAVIDKRSTNQVALLLNHIEG